MVSNLQSILKLMGHDQVDDNPLRNIGLGDQEIHFEFFSDIFIEIVSIKKEIPYFCIPLGEIP